MSNILVGRSAFTVCSFLKQIKPSGGTPALDKEVAIRSFPPTLSLTLLLVVA